MNQYLQQNPPVKKMGVSRNQNLGMGGGTAGPLLQGGGQK